MTTQTKSLNSKIITHHSHTHKKNLPCTLNRYNGFSGFGCPDPAETAVVEPVSSPAECCSGQRAESKENSSSPAYKLTKLCFIYWEEPLTDLQTKTAKLCNKKRRGKINRVLQAFDKHANIYMMPNFPTSCSFGSFAS